jgi:hypothetical protein
MLWMSWMLSIKRMTRSLYLPAGILLAAAFLIFWGLGQRYLWSDEAETALLASNILTYGVPKAFDGVNLVSQELGRDHDAQYIWRWTPWLAKYVVAGSFAVLGKSTVAARLPFALIGLLTIASIYRLAISLFKDRTLALLAMGFLATSVPFLLYARQARYYAIAIFAFVWAIYFLLALVEERKWAATGLVVSMTALFHSNYLTFFAAAVALSAGFLLYYDRRVLRKGLIAALWIAVLNAPWFVYFVVLGSTVETERLSSPFENFVAYLGLINAFSLPALAVVGFTAFRFVERRRGKAHPQVLNSQRAVRFLIVVAIVTVVVLSLAPWNFFRYIAVLLPVLALISAYMCRTLISTHRAAGVVFTVVLMLTGLLHEGSAQPFRSQGQEQFRNERGFAGFDLWFPLGNHLYEVTHDEQGPIEGMVDYLSEHARSGDRVFVSYGDLPVKFYTGLEVRGGQTGESLEGWGPPEWFIVRSFYRFGDRASMKEDADRVASWLKREMRWSEYERIELPVADVYWGNIPEPGLHRFRRPTGGARVVIGRKKAS